MESNNNIGKIQAIALIIVIMLSQIILNLANTILKPVRKWCVFKYCLYKHTFSFILPSYM